MKGYQVHYLDETWDGEEEGSVECVEGIIYKNRAEADAHAVKLWGGRVEEVEIKE